MKSILSLPGPGSAEGDNSSVPCSHGIHSAYVLIHSLNSQGVLGGSLVSIQDKSPTNT